MTLTVYTGLAATGKTSTIIRSMQDYRNDGGTVVLFLSAEHPELTRRRNVRPGGLMGCRDPELRFPIDHVCKTDETIKMLEELDSDSMAVFDEAQYFRAKIVEAWHVASKRGINVLVGTPSETQLAQLKKMGHKPTELTVSCSHCEKQATTVAYEDNMTYPKHLCTDCNTEYNQELLDAIIDDVRANEPFPGEDKTYQPFHNVNMEGWDFVRPDSLVRFELIQDAVGRCKALSVEGENAENLRSYLDLGCCSGFFCDAMTNAGYFSSGVDVQKNFLDWAGRIANLKGQNIKYVCENARDYLTKSDEMIDVTSSFATIQWVMAQQGYESGVECFKHLFDRTRHICVVEMGYTLEDIYKEKIPDRPREIDKNWVLDIMQEYGGFAKIEVHLAGENGIWRDIFVGFKEEPALRDFRREFESETVHQISPSQQSWDDKWIGSSFEVFFQAQKELTQGQLSGWIPDRPGGVHTDISICLTGVEVQKLSVAGNEFSCTFDCNVREGVAFGLSMESTQLDFENAEDNRPLSFMLKDLFFT